LEHMKNNHDEVFKPCKTCLNVFSDEAELEAHVRNHLLRDSNQCALCQEVSNSKEWIFLRIPDRYYRVVCQYQDGACRAKPLARRENTSHGVCWGHYRLKPLQPSLSEMRNTIILSRDYRFTIRENGPESFSNSTRHFERNCCTC